MIMFQYLFADKDQVYEAIKEQQDILDKHITMVTVTY